MKKEFEYREDEIDYKKLRFAEPLPGLVLSGSKDATWRLNDNKGLQAGDNLLLCRVDDKPFAKAEVLWVKSTFFKNLTNEDTEGHEPFDSDEQMYATYKKYYNQDVEGSTSLKVIKFRLLKND